MRRPAVWLVAGLLVLSTAACDSDEPDNDNVTEYVALGDSHTAAPHTPETDLSVPCYRSEDNYPAVLAKLLPDAVLDDVSCSGATTAAMTDEQDSRGTPVPPQLDALSDETDLVTVNVGGNDENLSIGWFSCYQLTASDPQGSPCADSNATIDGDVLLDKIPQIKDNVRRGARRGEGRRAQRHDRGGDLSAGVPRPGHLQAREDLCARRPRLHQHHPRDPLRRDDRRRQGRRREVGRRLRRQQGSRRLLQGALGQRRQRPTGPGRTSCIPSRRSRPPSPR